MNGGRPSSRNGPWNDANAALICAICETIDLTSEDSQCQSFRRSVIGRIHDGVSREDMI